MSYNVIFIISIILYSILFLFRKKIDFLYYQLFSATIYLFSLSFIQTLDKTLALYIIFSVLPYIKNFKINGIIESYFFLYFSIVLLFSIITNGVANAISIFVIRFIGILMFTYIFKNITVIQKEKNKSEEKNIIKILLWFAICEIFITVLAYYISGGDSRLMLNYQCTVGDISVAGTLLVGYYLNICKTKKRLSGFLYALFFSFIAIISGTRGYLIICLALTFIYFMLYGSKAMKFFAVLIAMIILVSSFDDIITKFMDITRLGTSTGRRASEDMLVWKYMPKNKIRMMIGYGFGKPVNSLPNISYIISSVSDTTYTNYILYRVSGFHNLYTTVYYSSGIIGIFFTLLIFGRILFLINSTIESQKSKITSLAFIGLYMFVLWYRWTATSGILEFSVLAFILINSKRINS